jgi:hypothetical protein
MQQQSNKPPLDQGPRGARLKVRLLGAAAVAALSLAPVGAFAGDQSPYAVPLHAPAAG